MLRSQGGLRALQVDGPCSAFECSVRVNSTHWAMAYDVHELHT